MVIVFSHYSLAHSSPSCSCVFCVCVWGGASCTDNRRSLVFMFTLATSFPEDSMSLSHLHPLALTIFLAQFFGVPGALRRQGGLERGGVV